MQSPRTSALRVVQIVNKSIHRTRPLLIEGLDPTSPIKITFESWDEAETCLNREHAIVGDIAGALCNVSQVVLAVDAPLG